MYHCGACGKPVSVIVNGDRSVVVRACDCKAPIVAEARARLEGRGGLR